MTSLARRWIVIGAVVAAVGVALGAFGAHGLDNFLERRGYTGDDLVRRLDIFDTAVRYQLMHAIALVLTGLALDRYDSRAWRLAAWAFLVGILLFSGLLKVMTFAGAEWKWLGRFVPFGGVAMIIGWITFAAGAIGASKAK
jgi:uncharacterized membrane protein YgdD (TMEM256/DUF423 family)